MQKEKKPSEIIQEFLEFLKFCADRQNKQFIDRLKSLLEQQERAEQYVLSERHYNRRGEIANDTN